MLFLNGGTLVQIPIAFIVLAAFIVWIAFAAAALLLLCLKRLSALTVDDRTPQKKDPVRLGWS